VREVAAGDEQHAEGQLRRGDSEQRFHDLLRVVLAERPIEEIGRHAKSDKS
jgi:hypothetical protein